MLQTNSVNIHCVVSVSIELLLFLRACICVYMYINICVCIYISHALYTQPHTQAHLHLQVLGHALSLPVVWHHEGTRQCGGSSRVGNCPVLSLHPLPEPKADEGWNGRLIPCLVPVGLCSPFQGCQVLQEAGACFGHTSFTLVYHTRIRVKICKSADVFLAQNKC